VLDWAWTTYSVARPPNGYCRVYLKPGPTIKKNCFLSTRTIGTYEVQILLVYMYHLVNLAVSYRMEGRYAGLNWRRSEAARCGGIFSPGGVGGAIKKHHRSHQERHAIRDSGWGGGGGLCGVGPWAPPPQKKKKNCAWPTHSLPNQVRNLTTAV
jgi:hypothetical protein